MKKKLLVLLCLMLVCLSAAACGQEASTTADSEGTTAPSPLLDQDPSNTSEGDTPTTNPWGPLIPLGP